MLFSPEGASKPASRPLYSASRKRISSQSPKASRMPLTTPPYGCESLSDHTCARSTRLVPSNLSDKFLLCGDYVTAS